MKVIYHFCPCKSRRIFIVVAFRFHNYSCCGLPLDYSRTANPMRRQSVGLEMTGAYSTRLAGRRRSVRPVQTQRASQLDDKGEGRSSHAPSLNGLTADLVQATLKATTPESVLWIGL